ncbi:MAG: beta-lactamase family protein [Saprospiraceae bacterium]|nr:beta-lactamase family protein [Saprospiraceae bacterium]
MKMKIKIRKTNLFICLVCLALLFIYCKNEEKIEDEIPEVLTKKIDSIGQFYIDQHKTGAISIAVVRGDSLLYNNAFGFADHDQKIPVTPDHYFLMASVSKLVGTVMVMKLVEEGKLSLDQTLAELLPDYTNLLQAGKITLRHLLSHTSGLLDYAIKLDTVYIETGKAPVRKDYMNFFAENDLLFEPGEYYAYSNSGFKLMEFIVEKATGNKFADEIDRIINDHGDLDLKLIAERINDPLMTEYFSYSDTALIPEEHWTWISGDGGMTTTSAGLARFAQKWSDGTLISKKSFVKMTTPFQLNSGISSGYGLGTRTGDFEGWYTVGHTGGNESTMAMMMYFPDRDISIAVFDNTDGSPTSTLSIIGYVALAVMDREEPMHENQTMSQLLKDSYAGFYDMYGYVTDKPDALEIYFDEEEQHMFRKYVGAQSKGQKLVFLGNDTFAIDPYMMDRLEFVRDASGNVVAYRNYWNGLFQRMGFKAD